MVCNAASACSAGWMRGGGRWLAVRMKTKPLSLSETVKADSDVWIILALSDANTASACCMPRALLAAPGAWVSWPCVLSVWEGKVLMFWRREGRCLCVAAQGFLMMNRISSSTDLQAGATALGRRRQLLRCSEQSLERRLHGHVLSCLSVLGVCLGGCAALLLVCPAEHTPTLCCPPAGFTLHQHHEPAASTCQTSGYMLQCIYLVAMEEGRLRLRSASPHSPQTDTPRCGGQFFARVRFIAGLAGSFVPTLYPYLKHYNCKAPCDLSCADKSLFWNEKISGALHKAYLLRAESGCLHEGSQ